MQHRLQGRSSLSAPAARALLNGPSGRDAFDRLTRLAGLALRTQVAMLGVVEEDQLRLISQVGLPEPWATAGALPLDATLCQFVANSGDVFVVEDAARHPLAFAIPKLDNFSRVAYCGAPVQVYGVTLAVLSVTDSQPRRWTSDDVTVLRDLAAALLRDLELLAEPMGMASRATAAGAVPLEALPFGLITVDSEWRFTLANSEAQQLLGRDEASLLGAMFWDVFPGLVGSVVHHEALRVLSDRVAIELEHYCAPLGLWLELRASPTPDGGAAIQLRDISERRTEQDELRGREARYRHLFEESHTPLFVMAPDSRMIEVNHACEQLLGRDRNELYRMRMAELAADTEIFERVLDEVKTQGAVTDAEIVLRRRDDHIVCLMSASAQGGEDAVAFHGALHDITAHKKTQEELVRSALHDPLTSLPNRVVLMDRLERLVKHAKRRSGYGFAVLFLDLDTFKLVNDTFGHLVGDQLLIGVARRLENCVRQEDTVARIGGDEFAVLLDMIDEPGSVTVVVDRIRESLSKPFDTIRGAPDITASIGIALSMTGYDRAEEMLHDADTAMYRAKRSGRNAYVMFDSEMQERAQAQRQLEDDLRTAMSLEQLAVHYHPVVELERGAVTGLEALLRWAHPERGILLPHDFIPLAEQTGLIVEIGWWVLREACRQLRSWQLEYPDAAFSLTMGVNLSAKQFVHPGLVDKIDEILADTELDPRCLRLDLTEAVVMYDSELTVQLLRQLRARGVQICIDDFGTGFTSLRQLRQFPISTLKIDRSFIHKLTQEGGEGHEVVQTIIALGRSMAIDAIAEGVETPEQLEQLRKLGTRFAQGFLFSLPLDTLATSKLLEGTAV